MPYSSSSLIHACTQSDAPRKRVFRKFKYRGIDLAQLVGLTVTQRMDELLDIVPARVRRK